MAPISERQRAYIKKRKRDRTFIRVLRILILVVFIIIWEWSAQTGAIDSFIFSSPSRLASTFLDLLWHGHLLRHIAITVVETMASFVLVLAVSLLSAMILWNCTRLSRILDPYLVILNSLPKSALAPLLIVWLGSNIRTIIVAGMSVAIFGAVLTLYTDFRSTDPNQIKLVRTLGGTKRDILFKVVLPSSLDQILSVMKVNIGLCLVGVVIGEFIGAKEGLGYLIIYGSQVFKLDWVILSILLLCIIAMSLYGLISSLHLVKQSHHNRHSKQEGTDISAHL